MLNEHDLNTWREEMITVDQAKQALEAIADNGANGCMDTYYTLSEFIKQYEDWVKVKTMTHGVLLKGKDE